MDAALLAILNTAIQSGFIGETTLILLVIGIIVLCYRYVWKPTKVTVEKLPTLESIETLLGEAGDANEKTLANLSSYLEKIDIKLQSIDDKTTGSEREIQDMKNDVDSIREIVNQIHGHLLYSSHPPSAFGNRELK